MPGIWDAIKSLILGQQQPVNPMVQNLAQAGFPGAQQMMQQPQPRQGGLVGAFQQPGSLMEALGVPLALFGSIEAARGKPVGSALLGGVGDILGQLGQYQSGQATATNTANALLKEVNKQFPQFSNDQGLQESVKGVIAADPTKAITNIEALQKHLEEQSKTKIDEYNAFAQAAGYPTWAAAPQDAKAKILQSIGTWKRKVSGTTPGFLVHPLAAKLYAMGVADPDNATPEQVKSAYQLDRLEKLGDKKSLMDYAASKGLVPIYNPDTDSYNYGPKSTAAGMPVKPGKGSKVEGGYVWSPITELGPDVTLGFPMPPKGMVEKGMTALGLGDPKILNYRGTPIKARRVTRADGKIINVFDLPDGRHWTMPTP